MPAHTHAHPVDVLTADLVALYSRGQRRLEELVAQGLHRGLDPDRLGTEGQRRGDATQAYRARQLAQANAILAELRTQGQAAANLVTAQAYGTGLAAVDATVGRHAGGRQGIDGRFGGIHTAQVDTLAANLTNSLGVAAAKAGNSLELVFARAGELEGALAPGPQGGLPRDFIGRRRNDPYRRLALEQIGAGVVGLETRRQISAGLARRLVAEGVTDAVTGFVDSAGRRWSLERYAKMAVRTTTREAASRATATRLVENGSDLVTVSEHVHPADECTPYEGNTYSLTGATAGYEELDVMPPFHPECVHVIYPAGAELDDFERMLEEAAGGQAPPVAEPGPAAPAPAPAPIAPPVDLEPPAPPRPRPRARAPKAPAPMPPTLFTGLERVARYGRPRGQRTLDGLLKRGWVALEDGYTTRYELTALGREAIETELRRRAELEAAAKAAEVARLEAGVAPKLNEVLKSSPNKAVRATLEHVSGLIDRVHDLPVDLPSIPLKVSTAKRKWGSFKFAPGAGRPIHIDIVPKGPHLEETLAHEVGHFLDFTLFRAERTFGSSFHPGRIRAGELPPDPAMAAILEAAENSRAIKAIREALRTGQVGALGADGTTIVGIKVDRTYASYLVDRNEVFARAYAQYLGTRTGDKAILDASRQAAGSGYHTQWETDDFEPIAAAFDELFRSRGLLKGPTP